MCRLAQKDARLLGKAAGEAAAQLCTNPDVTKVTGTAPFTSPGPLKGPGASRVSTKRHGVTA